MSDLITIESNLPAVQEQLQTLARKVGTIRPALKGIGQALEQSTRDRWDAETGPDGEKWQALKSSTLARKRRQKKPLKILLQDDHLRYTINSQVEGETLIVGSPEKYAPIQQLGGEIKQEARAGVVTHFKKTSKGTRFSKVKGATHAMKVNHKARTVNIPARPFLGVSQSDEADILHEIEMHLTLDQS